MKQLYQLAGLVACLLMLFQPVVAQEKQPAVKGAIKNEKSEPLAGVSVMLQNSGTGYTASTQTDESGMFVFTSLEPGGPYRFTFTYVGYEKKVLEGYRYQNGEMISLAATLQPAAGSLNDIVVVGYGTQKKVNLTGAVDQVSGEVLNNRSVPNVVQGLKGIIPNLNITLGDGKPIQAPAFNIRGTTSIGQGGNALVLIDGVEGDPSLLNPNDVATFTVLKDAASAAIYGARGAFGVILITTKNPSLDRMSVTYSMNYSLKQPTTVPDLVTDGYQWAKTFNEAWTAWNDYSQTPQNVNKTMKFSQAYLEELERRSMDPGLPRVEVNNAGEYVYYASTDWYALLYKNVHSAVEHNISFSGSNDKSGFYLTGRYFGQDGLFRYNSDDYKMFNLRAKGYIQLYPWLRIENNTDFSNVRYHNPLNVGEGGGIWRNIADEGHPMAPMFNPDGTLTHSAAFTVGDFWYGRNGIDFDRRIIKNTTGFTAQLLPGQLRLKGDFTIQNTDNDERRIRVPVPFSRKPGVIEYVGSSTNDIQNIWRETEYMAGNLYGEWERKLAGRHDVKAMAGFNFEQTTYKRTEQYRNGLIFEDAEDINLALGQSVSTSGGWERWAVMGGFYRLNYAYHNKYLLEVNGRYDGSSKFPDNERYAFFPSVSAAWRVSNESFWNVPRSVISDLKLRISYGSLGNGSIGSYEFQEKFSITQSGRILNGVRPQRTGQPNVIPDGLTWETATTQNIGFDLTMASGRLNITGDAYIRKTTDMFTVGVSLPAVFGTGVPKGNYADLKTTGWELTIAWRDQVRLAAKPLNYELRVVLADQQAEITKYNNPDKKLTDYYVGQKVGEIWGYVTEGFFVSEEDIDKSAKQNFRSSTTRKLLPGDIKFRDINGDGEINPGENTVSNPGDRVIIGNSTPRYTYGITLGADWNNFFFGAFFQGVGKQDWWPGAEADVFWGQYNRPYNDPPKSHAGKIWSEENPNTYFPRLRGYTAQNGEGAVRQVQTRYLQNIAYIRLKNIQLGYNLPASLTSKVKMSNARIYVTAENLWSWSPLYKITRDLDVESTGGSDRVLTSGTSGNGNNYPMLKSITFGLSVTF